MRDRAAMFDLTAFCIFDVDRARRARDGAARSRCARWTSANGKVVYTPVLSPSGTFKSDLTVMRLGDEQFRVVTGGAHGMADLKWYADHAPADGSAQVTDLTSAWTTLGLWGPRARDILASADARRRLARRLPVRHVPDDRARLAARARLAHLLRRRARLGALRADGAGREAVGPGAGRPGEPHGVVPAGIGVYGTTGRLEKCYRAFGFELDADYNVVEAGMALGQGEGARLRRQGRARRAPRVGAGGGALHAHRRRPHLDRRDEALHARP